VRVLAAMLVVAVSGSGKLACRKGSPDRDYYRETAERLGHNRACLSIARKLLKRSYHALRELGEEALTPA
jgi:transposase